MIRDRVISERSVFCSQMPPPSRPAVLPSTVVLLSWPPNVFIAIPPPAPVAWLSLMIVPSILIGRRL